MRYSFNLAHFALRGFAAEVCTAESFDEFYSKERCRECSTAAVIRLNPRFGEFVKIFSRLRLIATKP